MLSCQDQARLKLSKRVGYLVKDTLLYDHFLMDYDGVSSYRTLAHKENNRADFKIYYHEIPTFAALFKKLPPQIALDTCYQKGVRFFDETFTTRMLKKKIDNRIIGSDQPLEGIKIAIDPVHIGGSHKMAEIEHKLVKVITNSGDTLLIDEGLVTLATARLLAKELRRLGAEVLLTRYKVGESAVGKSYFRWLKEDFRDWVAKDYADGALERKDAEYLKFSAGQEYIYNQYFKMKDLKARAQRINRFKPDLTVMIRYNVDEKNWIKRDTSDFMRTTKMNYALAFVPGAFMNKELASKRDRVEFMRLLLTDNFEKSVDFSQILLKNINYKLGVPAILATGKYEFLKNSSVYVEKGIYSRNLSMTRLVHSPLSYGEVLCIDNVNEAIELSKVVVIDGNLQASRRVEQVADTYVASILEYFNPAPKDDTPITADDLEETKI